MPTHAAQRNLVRQFLAKQPKMLSPEEFAEWKKCRADFWHFAITHVMVMDQTVGERVPFVPYPGQRRILDTVLSGRWLWLLKARRLGATAALLIYAMWLLIFRKDRRVIGISEGLPAAEELLNWYIELEESLPEWMQPRRETKNTKKVKYVHGSQFIVRAGTKATGRSLDCDLLIPDEAAFIAELAEVRKAAEPTLETSRGVSAVMSTSAGMGNEFHAGWMAAERGESNYVPLFLSCFDRPGRDQAWYDRESDLHKHEPLYMYREYPRTPQEAFMAAAGRCFKNFLPNRNIMACDRPEGATLHRAIDFGDTAGHASVCLWLWHDEDAMPRLTFAPDADTIYVSSDLIDKYASGTDQMYAYCRDPKKGTIIKRDDDVCDALRYVITHHRMTGHVHVYRLLFVHNGENEQWSMLQFFRWIMEMSGWETLQNSINLWQPGANHEKYDSTIADRAGSGFIGILREAQRLGGFDLRVRAYRTLDGVSPRDQVEQGIAWMNALIAGDLPFRAERYRTKEDEHEREVRLGIEKPPSRLVEVFRDDLIRERTRNRTQRARPRRTGMNWRR